MAGLCLDLRVIVQISRCAPLIDLEMSTMSTLNVNIKGLLSLLGYLRINGNMLKLQQQNMFTANLGVFQIKSKIANTLGNNFWYELTTIGITLNYLINVYQCLPKKLSVSAIFQKFTVLIIWDMKLTFCCGWTCIFIRRCHKRIFRLWNMNIKIFWIL